MRGLLRLIWFIKRGDGRPEMRAVTAVLVRMLIEGCIVCVQSSCSLLRRPLQINQPAARPVRAQALFYLRWPLATGTAFGNGVGEVL
jgi:hypothetical protein